MACSSPRGRRRTSHPRLHNASLTLLLAPALPAFRSTADTRRRSHSTRLLVTDGAADGEVARLSADTCLGAELAAAAAASCSSSGGGSGSGDGAALAGAATLRAVEEYAGLLRRRGVARVRAVATAALRDCAGGGGSGGGDGDTDAAVAAARARLGAAIEAALGCRLEVLSAEEEGALAFAGAAGAAADAPGAPCVVVDLGGRSTELCFGAPAPSPPLSSPSDPL